MHYISKKTVALRRSVCFWFLFLALFSSAGLGVYPQSARTMGRQTETDVSVESAGGRDAAFDEGSDGAPGEARGGATVLREEDIRIPSVEIPSDTALPENRAAASSTGILFRLVVTLVLLCVACYFILRFLKKSAGGGSADDPFLKNVASLPIAPGKSVSIVTVGGQAFLLGLSERSVTFIAELHDAELIDKMNLHADIASSNRGSKSFGDILAALLPKMNAGGGKKAGPSAGAEAAADFSSSATETAASLRKSRGRLQSTRTNPSVSQDGARGDSSGGPTVETEPPFSGSDWKTDGDRGRGV